jgi:hypothetical protein
LSFDPFPRTRWIAAGVGLLAFAAFIAVIIFFTAR